MCASMYIYGSDMSERWEASAPKYSYFFGLSMEKLAGHMKLITCVNLFEIPLKFGYVN